MNLPDSFWLALDRLAAASAAVIDDRRSSAHRCSPELIDPPD